MRVLPPWTCPALSRSNHPAKRFAYKATRRAEWTYCGSSDPAYEKQCGELVELLLSAFAHPIPLAANSVVSVNSPAPDRNPHPVPQVGKPVPAFSLRRREGQVFGIRL